MAKKSPKKNSNKVLAIDIGGTKVLVAAIDGRGKILAETREAIDIQDGYKSLVRQISNLAHPLVKKYKLKHGGVASAGPLDPIKGVLLNPTNLKTKNQSWGVVPLIRELEKNIGVKLVLENDAAAAAYAEFWVGRAKKTKNLVVLTLGTGLGVGVIANGRLLRSGRNLHPEVGHVILDYKDKEWLCGCGNYGCAEAYLSGVNFTQQLKKKWGQSDLTGEKILSRAKNKDTEVLHEFEQYAKRLAAFLSGIVAMFSPEKIILSGGFSHAAELFLPQTTAALDSLIASRRVGEDLKPEILTSKFVDEACLIGAAYVAQNHNHI